LTQLEPIIVDFNSDCDSDVDTPNAYLPPKRYNCGMKQLPKGIRTSDIYMPSECPTPYPPSTSDSDSDSESDSESDESVQLTSTQSRFEEASELQESIASASEAQLRQLVAKLAHQNPGFQQAVAKELRAFPEDPSTPVDRSFRSPPSRSPRRGRRRPRRASAPQPSRHRQHQLDRAREEGALGYDECGRRVYHPGRLVKDVYEFLSTSDDGRRAKVLETITMWSCCDQDALMPGCRQMTRSLDDSDTEVITGRLL